MITDNGMLLNSLIKATKKQAFFEKSIFNGKMHYLASNRKARLLLKSNRFLNKAKKVGLIVDLENKTVC